MWARIENDTVQELTEIDPAGRFHESLIWVEVNDSVECGFKLKGGLYCKVEKVEPKLSKDQIENLRLVEYANPITGIDRHFAEVLSLQAEGFAASSTEVKEAKAKGLARKAEIQALYPYPVE